MPKSAEPASEKVLDEQEADTVFDFLYCDAQRIASFLGQIDPFGYLKEVSQQETVSRGSKRGFKIGLGGGATLVGTGGSGNVAFERSPETTGSEGSVRVYDPAWANAREFLDILDEHSLINNNLANAHMGQFVQATGQLQIVDLSVMKSLLDNPIL